MGTSSNNWNPKAGGPGALSWLAAVVLLLPSSLLAQGFLVTEIRELPDGRVSFLHEAATDSYYILYRGRDVTTILEPADIALGPGPQGELLDEPPPAGELYYRILKVSRSKPRDTDGDGIHDVFELTYPSVLNPFDPLDAFLDPDGDGFTNREESQAGTDPGTFSGVRITSPEPGTTLASPTSVNLAASAESSIVSVQFFEGINLIASDAAPPFTGVWNNVPVGEYLITAVGSDGVGGQVTSKPVQITVNLPEAEFAVSATATREDTVELTGSTLAHALVTVIGGAQTITGQAQADGSVNLTVPLQRNKLNRLFVTVEDGGGRLAPPIPFEVTQDSDPPHLFIDFPPSTIEHTASSAVIAGRVGDMLSGFMGLNVTVNGQPANVIVGIGQNGTYERGNVPLSSGVNVITVVATDALGNSTTRTTRLNRVPLTGTRLLAVSGDGQAGVVRNVLPNPIVVQVQTATGAPFINKLVTFEVIRSDGRLKDDPDSEESGGMLFQTFTDANGMARAYWMLGNDAGCGNNRMRVTSSGVSGTVFFCASADAEAASQINVGSGNNLKAEAGSLSPEPMVAWVNDSCNGVDGIPVTFTVIQGDGLVNDQSSVTVTTGVTGHAPVEFRLGLAPGNNLVEADFPGNPGFPAVFVIEGVARSPDQPTSFTGMVLNNARLPIEGALCTLEVEGHPVSSAISGPDGTFTMVNTPSGPAHLHVEGGPATAVAGQPIPQGTYPALAYQVLVIPNAENSLPVPVLLPPLDPTNERSYDGTEDVELTVAGMDGLKMIVKAGSMSLADGTKPSPENPATLTLNQVHHDDIPMPMPDGAAPPFAWTLQPAGAVFDPPIQIEYPNMSSLPAGAIAYFLSFNHDTESFEIVATGHVLDDGSKIVTDPGVGLTIAGWGCNCPPYAVTASCINLVGGTRVRDPTEPGPQGPPNCNTECFDNGRLTAGSVSPSGFVVCVGDTVTFNPPNVTDSGGTNITICTFPDGSQTTNLTSIAAGGVTYRWRLFRGSTLVAQGAGRPARVALDQPGSYSCQWTATPTRTECPPADLTLPNQTATAIGVASISGLGVTSTTSAPGPAETIKVCLGDEGETISLTAQSTHGTWPAGQPVWQGANGNGSTAIFPIDRISTDPAGDLVRVICNGSVKAIRVLVVEVESVSGEGVTSTTNFPGDNETIYVCRGNPGDTITLTANPRPGTMWPAGQPEWIIDRNMAGTGPTYMFPIDTASTVPVGTLVTVRCGVSEKSIAVVVVHVDFDIRQALSADSAQTEVQDDAEEAPGMVLCTNDDDDDGNNRPDNDDLVISGTAVQRTEDMKD
ncbi:MAG TPA: Ig-like domain-containing protein, partial [Methylomirabilota bacterium]|nr:Ig-like domain-containing protein [Methylomirabilota bacterium]